MDKIYHLKFINNEMNLTTEGFVLNQTYPAVRRQSANKNNRVFFTFKMPDGESKHLWLDPHVKTSFVEVDENGNPIKKDSSQEQSAPGKQPEKQPEKKTESASENSNASTQGVTVKHLMQLADMIKQLNANTEKKHEQVMETIYELVNSNPGKSSSGEKDVFFAGIEKLNFENLKIHMIKVDGKTTMTVIMDGMPPFNLAIENFSGVEIIQKIVELFSETSLVSASIKAYKERIAAAEAEAKKAAASAEKKSKASTSGTTRKSAAGGSKKNETEKPASAEKKEEVKDKKEEEGKDLFAGEETKSTTADAPKEQPAETPKEETASPEPSDTDLPNPDIGSAFSDFVLGDGEPM